MKKVKRPNQSVMRAMKPRREAGPVKASFPGKTAKFAKALKDALGG
jgi:hypothetical protein